MPLGQQAAAREGVDRPSEAAVLEHQDDVDGALADLEYLSLPDGSVGRLIYERTRVSDRVEREGLYRRDRDDR